MAIEKVKELIKTIQTDPKAQETLKGLVRPTDEGWIKYYAEAAKLLGYEATEADIRVAIAEIAKERTEKTEKMAAGVQSLPDDELDKVAGGKNTYYVPRWEDCDSVVGNYTEVVTCHYDFTQGYVCREVDACTAHVFYYINFTP